MKEKLDSFVLNIEFLLISVVQGLALSALAAGAIGPLSSVRWEVMPLVLCGFLIILTFWSGAIIHALSFIDWPMSMLHSFWYFLVGFLEVIIFGQMMNSLLWFFYMGLFFLVILILYIWDLRIIKKHRLKMVNSEPEKRLYQHILEQQLFEMRFIVPLGVVFNFLAAYLVWNGVGMEVFLGVVEALFLGWFLVTSLKSFQKRGSLLSKIN